MITNTLIFLAELSWELGLIGIVELEERIGIALWLSDESNEKQDPRLSDTESDFEKSTKEDFNSSLFSGEGTLAPPDGTPKDEDNTLAFIAWKIWYFTGSDPDSYPSVPHGHFQNANNKWPKLNPYTGRVFSNKNIEDNSSLLTKRDMQTLWRDVDFRNFCRTHIIWYMQKYSHYRFPVRNPLRLPRW
jgi:hypothetical protein